MKKYILPFIAALTLLLLSFVPEVRLIVINQLGSPKAIEKEVLPVTLTFVGDIMMTRGVESSLNKNFKGDFSELFKNTAYLKESDITFGNLEGAVANGGRNVGSRFSFRMKPVSLMALRGAGFDIVSFANNHVGDYSTTAFIETLENLATNSILYTGAGKNYTEVITPAIINVRDIKIGFLATSDVGPNWLKATDQSTGLTAQAGILLASDPKLSEVIKNAKTKVDILVVSYHWGNEYSPTNARQIKLAHSAIDSGADIVVGHHPHVMQRVEIYKDKPIFYSLGNFIFDQYFSPHTMRGMVAQVSIDPYTKVIKHKLYVSPQSKQFIPQALIPFDEAMLITKTFTP